MSYGLPDDWFIEETGEQLILDQEKVAAELNRLQTALQEIADLAGVRADEAPEMARRALTPPHLAGVRAIPRNPP